MVGLIPLLAVETVEPALLHALPGFKKRFDWFVENRPDLQRNVACLQTHGREERRLLAVVDPETLGEILEKMLDENKFLSPHGIRSLSRFHREHPLIVKGEGAEHRVDYEPAESSTGLFGRNSNWRGPIWSPVNYLIIEALQKFHPYLGDGFKVECPTGSGKLCTLQEVADQLSLRQIDLFKRDPHGHRAIYGTNPMLQNDPFWRNQISFYEYFNADTGEGLGASHQTGWTALVAKLI